MANIYEVAERAGVSVATVSRIINNSGAVTDKTRQRVVTAMAELGYRPSSIAQALATNRTNCVGVLVSELHGPFFGDMLSALELELRDAGKFVIVTAGHSVEASEKAGLQFLIGRNCDALIVHVEALADQYLRDHDGKPAPLVVMNRTVPGLVDHCVTLDNEYGGYLATRYLLGKGHTRIAYISGPLSWLDASQRFAGHKRALAEAGIKPDKRLLVEGDYHEAAGAAALSHLLDTGLPFTAIASGNDQMAAGVMVVARDRGLRIPEDLSIVGFDNAPISRYLHPKLSTIDYPIADMGRMAARWVLRHVYGDGRIEALRNFEPSLVERDSVASLRQPAGVPAGTRAAGRRPRSTSRA
jgi:LacI family transcriptional regulator